MDTRRFTATLLRASSSGFAAMAVTRAFERSGMQDADAPEAGGEFDAWRKHFDMLVLELAAAVEDGIPEQFAARVSWARAGFLARGAPTGFLSEGLQELETVLQESLPKEAWGTLTELFQAARARLEGAFENAAVSPPVEGPMGELVDTYVATLRRGRGAEAIERVVEAVRAGRLTIPDALDGVCAQSMREIGELWHAGVINVAEEHFATQTTGRLLEQVMLLAPKAPALERTVLLTMVEGDAHELGLRIVAAFFELDGWNTICLGGNTPLVDLDHCVQSHTAHLVVIGATLNTQREAVAKAIAELRAGASAPRVIVGGAAFAGIEGRAQEIGADAHAPSGRDAVRLGRELLGL